MTSFKTVHDEIAALREKNEALTAELADIKAERETACVILMSHFRLTRTEANILELLAKWDHALKADYLLDNCCRDETISNVIPVHIKSIRHKIAPLVIKNYYGFGFELEPASRAAIRAIISKAKA